MANHISYPAGQGPLANRPVTVGANGLYNAPEEEGPEEHEGKQFLQLNVAEGVKYGEYWADACEGNETVTGPQLFEFMQRAPKVSKSQLRTIWEIVDHRKEGELDRDTFFIAVRLLALGQRGAELSMKGLRNFVGIQLIPQVSPRPEPVAPPPAPATPTSGNTAGGNSFSWTVPAELIGRYDRFFDGLDLARSGIVDGKQGFTFFSKSGLPRPALRQIWQLADITADGMLDRDEFRQAMHLVTGVKNGRISVEQFPERLHPSTPFWLRPIGAPIPTPENININNAMAPQGQAHGTPPPPPPSDPPPPPPPADGVSSDRSYSDYSNHASPNVSGMGGMGAMGSMPGIGGMGGMPNMQHMQQPQQLSPSMATRTGSEADDVRAQLQRERMEADRVRREMEDMQAELEKVRLEKKESLQMQKQQYEEMAAAKQKAEAEAAKAKAELVKTKIERTRSNNSTPAHTPKITSRQTPVGQLVQPISNTLQAPPSDNAENPLSLDALSKAYAKAPAPATKIEDDDIWNEPSPEIKPARPPGGSGGLATLNVGPSAVPVKKTKGSAKDVEYSSDEDDDDDFWGMGAKPTLGGSSTAAGKGNGNTQGKDQLDDWLF